MGAQWAVVPEAVDAAVDFGCLVDEPSAFAQGHDVIHGFDGRGGLVGGIGGVGHWENPLRWVQSVGGEWVSLVARLAEPGLSVRKWAD